MRRDLQSNEVRTNICFEFNVIGKTSLYQLQKDILELSAKYIKEGENTSKLVGLTLRKPTSSSVFITSANLTLGVEETQQPIDDEAGNVEEEEEVELDDQESNRND